MTGVPALFVVSDRYNDHQRAVFNISRQMFSGRGFLGLPQKGISSHLHFRSPVPFIILICSYFCTRSIPLTIRDVIFKTTRERKQRRYC